MSQIGDVHRLPLEARPDADLKMERPWLLLHTPSTDTPSWAFAYGSTQTTESALHATVLPLAWTRASTGRLERTRFYPARLRTLVDGETGGMIGRTAGADERIRSAFRGVGDRHRRGAPNVAARARAGARRPADGGDGAESGWCPVRGAGHGRCVRASPPLPAADPAVRFRRGGAAMTGRWKPTRGGWRGFRGR